MSEQGPIVSWQQPPPEPGPAPGIEFGGFGARLVAYIFDGLIVALITFVLFVIGGGVLVAGASNGSGAVVLGGLVWLVGLVVLPLAYFPWFWAHGGATLGMRMLGLRVVRDRDGGPVSGGQAILRLVGYWVSGAVVYLGFIWIFIDRRRRGWHDLIAGTVVIRQA